VEKSPCSKAVFQKHSSKQRAKGCNAMNEIKGQENAMNIQFGDPTRTLETSEKGI
jgi:hypothetical protein